MDRVFFKEEQRFRQWWIWLLVLVAAIVSVGPLIYGIYSQEILNKPYGNNPTDTNTLVIILLLVSVLISVMIYFFYASKLVVEIRTSGLFFRYPPMQNKWKTFKKEEIEKFEIRTYRPVVEFNGWGIKGSVKNRAYNVSGNVGLQLYLKNGNKALFGTQEKQAMEYAMKKLMQEKTE